MITVQTQKENRNKTAGRQAGKDTTMKEYMVDFDFIETPYGRRPNWIRTFKTREEAEAFASTKTDAVVNEITWETC